MRRLWCYLTQAFDRAFYRGKGRQFLWLLVFIVGFYLIFWAIQSFLICDCQLNRHPDGSSWPVRILELMLDPGAFVQSYQYGGPGMLFFQLMVTLIGAIFFTSFMINTIGNWLDRNVENVSKGHKTYLFNDHVVLFGANAMLETVLKSMTADRLYKSTDFVIVTDGNVGKVRDRIYAQLPKKFYDQVYVVYGNRTELKLFDELHLRRAKSIYMLGEEAEAFHDARNLECWNLLRDYCTGLSRPIDCFLVLDRASAVRSFLYKENGGSTDSLNLTVINAVENLAQRVFVSRGFDTNCPYPSLDGDGIGKDSDKHVHLLVVGMTQISYAMATTAAHICHFPNFSRGIRTRITFMMPGIRQEMDYFRGRYANLMEMSYSRYVRVDEQGNEHVEEFFPDRSFLTEEYAAKDPKGFLDVEWEFIDAGIETTYARTMLSHCAGQHVKGLKQFSIAFCEHNAEGNVAASMCLPSEIYDNRIPVFVYQPYSGEVLNFARDTGRYGNIYPFGLKVDCFDPWLQTRLMRARRLKYVYDMQAKGESVTAMPADADLLKDWFDTMYSHQLSNLYAANSVEMKIRSIRGNVAGELTELTDEEVAVVAETEHNRWNVERLICGLRAMPADMRTQLRKNLCSEDAAVRSAAEREVADLKVHAFRHINIVPFEEMPEDTKAYDTAIARSLTLVMKDEQIVSYLF